MSTGGVITFEGVIRFHRKSRTGCLTCRKRKIKCDETAPICRNCHRRQLNCIQRPKDGDNVQQQQQSALSKPLTAPIPSSFAVNPTSLQMVYHFIDITSPTTCTNPPALVHFCLFLPQLLFSNPVCMHSVLAVTALHLGRLYEPSSSSDSQDWKTRASGHRRTAIRLILGPSANPSAQFLALSTLSLYTIASSLSLPSSSPKNVFSLVTLLHNIFSPLKQLVRADPWLQGWNFDRQGPSIAPSALSDPSNGFLAPLHYLYDTSMGLNLDREELDDPDIREAYQTAVFGLLATYPLTQIGFKGRGAIFWPALVGKRFVEILNKRRQRALVILYHYLMMLRDLNGQWWVSEVGTWVDYVYGLIDERWREWLREVTAASEKARTG